MNRLRRQYVYLHGFASSPASSKAHFFKARFAEIGEDLLIPQLDGGDFGHLTVSGQLQIVESILPKGPAVLMGSSMGGYLAALCAWKHPDLVHSLVLLAPAFYFPQRWALSLGPEKVARWKEAGYVHFYHHAEQREMPVHYGLIEDVESLPAAPAFHQPCLIFHGESDDVVPVGYSQEFAAQRENVDLRVLPSDHQLTDQKEQIWAGTREFLFGGNEKGAPGSTPGAPSLML